MGSKKVKVSQEQKDLAAAETKRTYHDMALADKQYADMMDLQRKANERGDAEFAWQRGLADEARARSAKYDTLWDETTGQQIKKFSSEADAYDTPARRAQLAGQAVADVESQADLARGATARGLTARGMNSVYDFADQELSIGLGKAAAANMAREAARREGLQLRAQAAGLGGGLAGATAGASGEASQYGLAGIGAGQLGMSAYQNAGNLYGLTSGVGQGWGNAATGAYNSIAQQNQFNANRNSGWGSLIGGIAGSFAGPFGGAIGTGAVKKLGWG